MTQNEAVRITFKLSVWDLYRFHVRHMLARAWFLLVIPGLMLGLAATLSIAVWLSPSGAQHANQVGLVFMNALPVSGLFLFFVFGVPYFSAISASKNPNLQGEIEYVISPSGVSCRGQHSQADIRWPAFVRAKELNWAFLLYPHKSIAHVLPKRGIHNQEDLPRLREILRENIKKAKLRS
jgi:hypothetical protein